MPQFYDGVLKLREFKASIKVEANRASVDSSYQLNNPSAKAFPVKVGSARQGLANMNLRKMNVVRPAPVLSPHPATLPFHRLEKTKNVKAMEDFLIDLVQTLDIRGEKTKAFHFFPEVDLDDKPVFQKINNYEVVVELPPEAKSVVSSYPVPTQIKKEGQKLFVYYSKHDFFLSPIFLKWTELDAQIKVSKSVVQKPGNQFTVTILVKNESSSDVRNVLVKDEYSALDVNVAGNQPNIKKVTPKDKSERIKYEISVDLKAKERKKLNYTLQQLTHNLKVANTHVSLNKELVAVGIIDSVLRIPLPFPPPKSAFVLPSGWSFDYLNGGDHHLNEIGMRCLAQNYNKSTERLSWSTYADFADKNFDDDYRWSVNHQVLRFNPGFSFQTGTPWLSKMGNTTVHNGVFKHDGLKRFSKAVVLLAGWKFDFTSSDHHINRISLKISNITFNKVTGEVRWKTSVIYADKNFDDHYRYQYQYIILGFDGEIVYKSFSGSDNGGSAMHNGSAQSNSMKNYTNAMVIPMGWNFDFKSSDHHINEHNFNVLNTRYNKTEGKVDWTASLKYADKNFDDDYYWGYHVAVIATNFGESRDYFRGPFVDSGGSDVESNVVDLNGLFRPVTWTNGICDGDETGVDCGGSSPAHNMNCIKSAVDPGNASSSDLYSLKNSSDRSIVQSYANSALMEYAFEQGQNFSTFYSGVEKPDRYVEAVAAFVANHMDYVSDGFGYWGSQSAKKTLLETAHRGTGDFNGDCEDHAILRAALLRSLGVSKQCIFCADHHNSTDQGQDQECHGDKKGSGGHTFNLVIYKGKYRILDYGYMQARFWSEKRAWNQHVVDNIWNDHYGKHWSKQDISPFGTVPMVNYPGNPCCPGPNWDWRTYFNDVTL